PLSPNSDPTRPLAADPGEFGAAARHDQRLASPSLRAVGPVRSLEPERLVVDRDTAFEVEQLRDGEPSGPGATVQLDVFDELRGERVQNAVDDVALLHREIAAIAVGDPAQPSGDRVEVGLVAVAGLDAFEVLGDGARSEL